MSYMMMECPKQQNRTLSNMFVFRLQAKPYGWMPGGGMSIEVTVAGYDRPHIFGAILGRDEAYTSIINHGKKADLEWAKRIVIGEGGDGKKDSDDNISVSSMASSAPSRASPARMRKSELEQEEDMEK